MTRDILLRLLDVEEDVWDEYLFQSDRTYRALSSERRRDLAARTRTAAASAAAQYSDLTSARVLEDYLLQNGICITEEHGTGDSLSGGVLALFTQPDQITLFPDKYARARDTAIQQGLTDLSGMWDYRAAALAHELYHLHESRHPEIFTLQKHVCLWRLGPLQNWSTVPALREIAARHFTRILLKLPFHPCIMELCLLDALQPTAGQALYTSILAHAKKQEECT